MEVEVLETNDCTLTVHVVGLLQTLTVLVKLSLTMSNSSPYKVFLSKYKQEGMFYAKIALGVSCLCVNLL